MDSFFESTKSILYGENYEFYQLSKCDIKNKLKR